MGGCRTATEEWEGAASGKCAFGLGDDSRIAIDLLLKFTKEIGDIEIHDCRSIG